jgi:hypothetical protein
MNTKTIIEIIITIKSAMIPPLSFLEKVNKSLTEDINPNYFGSLSVKESGSGLLGVFSTK